MSALVNPFVSASQQFVSQLGIIVPKILVAIIIWLIGSYAINLLARIIKKINIRGTSWDSKIIDFAIQIVKPLGKFILILVIMDYLQIASQVVGAIAQGLSLTIALALGISFGKALEDDAKNIVEWSKNKFQA
ncbi:MAG: hypothetical protein U9M98_03585 [Patescibacteria group bacterium]|nr:hypothetical protein [Patescibacteria group bacterium]